MGFGFGAETGLVTGDGTPGAADWAKPPGPWLPAASSTPATGLGKGVLGEHAAIRAATIATIRTRPERAPEVPIDIHHAPKCLRGVCDVRAPVSKGLVRCGSVRLASVADRGGAVD
ncbi:MAG: hypothetical protein ACRDGI_00335, partial [Candidatus Limnocylindrales bacterium]